MGFESLYGNGMQIRVGSDDDPGSFSTTISNDSKNIHFGTDVEAGVRVDDYGAWLLFCSFAAVATDASETAVERRVISNGCPDTHQDSIVLATEVVGHGFCLRS